MLLHAARSIIEERAAVRRFRTAARWLLFVSVLTATVLGILFPVRLDPRGAETFCVLIASTLALSLVCERSERLARLADGFGALAHLWTGGLICGVISLLALRVGWPLVDSSLMTADRALGLDGVYVLEQLARAPAWLLQAIAFAYQYTFGGLFLSLAVVALLGSRTEVWRAVICFVGALLTICVIFIVTPAKGLALWAPDDLLARLPAGSGRYFWQSFDQFYKSDSPVLWVGSINGVISFPSFHMVMALITAALWRHSLATLAPAALWTTAIMIGAVPLGGHYIVDLIAGAVVWSSWFGVSVALERGSFWSSKCRTSRTT